MTAAELQLSIVIPVFNERENLGLLRTRLAGVLTPRAETWEIVLVDDGSSDGTADEIARWSTEDPRIKLVALSRNFGHQAALVAGLSHARGRAVVSMDGDLQHPPELLPELLERWYAGYEVVQTIRSEPADDRPLKRAGSLWFYRVLSALTQLHVTPGAADFRLLSRPALDAFLACAERRRCNRALVQWIGFRYTEVPYTAAARHAGRSKYSFRAMFRLAGDAIFSFSTWPLRAAGFAGGLVSLAAGAYLVFVLVARLFFPQHVVPGWSSILAAVLVLGGVNLLVLWILGEYVGRMYEEVKQRPLYIVRPPAAAPSVDVKQE
ncbi:MAG: glycosyltransferase family 2 protein [Phycisphaerales bacterium]|nr:glycosyltransferase family 2 protein [Phycisphaerales bacterium]